MYKCPSLLSGRRLIGLLPMRGLLYEGAYVSSVGLWARLQGIAGVESMKVREKCGCVDLSLLGSKVWEWRLLTHSSFRRVNRGPSM
jgi:hypothetical protein